MTSSSTITHAIDQFVEDIICLPVNQSLDSVLENAIVAEHEIRLLFGAGHQLPDLYIGLINVFSLHPAARRTRTRQVEQGGRNFSDRYILPLSPRLRRRNLTPSTVFNIETFQEHWKLFTHDALSQMRAQDWENIIAAGGSVLACLIAPQANNSARRLNEFFQSSVHASSDIDLFLWGLTPEQVL